MMNFKSVLLALLALLPILSFAQKDRNVSGEYTYYAPSNVTLEQAKMTAEQHARIAALTKEFNMTVYQSNTSVLSNRGEVELDDFYSVGVTESRGIWIRDRKPTEFEISYEDGGLVVKAEVWGEAREIVGASTIVDAKVLRNGTEPKFESGHFKDGDDLYLYFRSPENGWLCAFLFDRYSNEVYCLLPYRESPEGAVQVKHDKEYVFFKADKNQPDWEIVDEYSMTCESDNEYNEIYVVFSPHKFSKPVSKETNSGNAPLMLDMKAFSNWLSKCQSKDQDMVVVKKTIEIGKDE